MRARTFRINLDSLIALAFVGAVGARTAVAPWLVVFDNLHWTAAYLAATLLAWRGLHGRPGEAERRPMRWFVAGLDAS